MPELIDASRKSTGVKFIRGGASTLRGLSQLAFRITLQSAPDVCTVDVGYTGEVAVFVILVGY